MLATEAFSQFVAVEHFGLPWVEGFRFIGGTGAESGEFENYSRRSTSDGL